MMGTGKRVIVVGGGSAGFAAAIAAARAGARTVLLERHGALGGMATAALVHSVCGLYRLRAEAGAVLAHPGFPSEFASRLMEEAAGGGGSAPVRMGRVDVLLHQPAAFARLADAMTAAEPNLETRLHTELIGVETETGVIHAVETICRGRRERLEADAFVDASGDAVLAWMAGAECEQTPAEQLQRPAFIFSLGGVETASLEGDGRLRLARRLVAATREGALPGGALGAQFRPTGRAGEVFVTLDLDDPDPPGLGFDPFSPRALAAMERVGRELAHALVRFLAGNVPGFAAAFLAALPARVGIRESRRVRGEARLEEADILCGATFPDAVALSTWPIEMREQATGARLRFPEGDRPCQIPLGALRARGFSNLFVAGRCLSGSHEAQAALRVIGTCLATGEAAGLAAAIRAAGTEPAASTVCAMREALLRRPCRQDRHP